MKNLKNDWYRPDLLTVGKAEISDCIVAMLGSPGLLEGQLQSNWIAKRFVDLLEAADDGEVRR